MGNPKVAIVTFCLAVGFILVVLSLPSSKMQITASVPTVPSVLDTKSK
jgi:hypothetical protein